MYKHYQSAIDRLNKTNTKQGLTDLNYSFIRLYNAGILTERELQRLDIKIVDKLIKLEV